MNGKNEPVPRVVVIAGPNGAGKSTAAGLILPAQGVTHFVNADVIARGLSAFDPESAALPAGRVMLQHLRQLAARRATFAFETTLASRTFAPWIAGLRRTGYAFDLYFFWIPTAETAVARVAKRVRSGGHFVPEETVRRRYDRGLANFFGLYRPLAARWRFYDNSSDAGPRLVASGDDSGGIMVIDEVIWGAVSRRHSDDNTTAEA